MVKERHKVQTAVNVKMIQIWKYRECAVLFLYFFIMFSYFYPIFF